MNRKHFYAAVLTALGACSDGQPLATPSAASLAVAGAQVNGHEVTLDFEGVPDGAFVGSRFRDVGVSFADFYVRDSYHGFAWYPPTSGSSQIIYADGPIHEQIRNSGMWFTEPVDEVSMSVTAGWTFALKCYNVRGELLGSDSTDGAWKVWADNGYLVPLVVPFPVVRQSVAARGIKHCSWRVVSGAGIDDIRFRRSTSELKVTCNGDLGENRVTRGKEITCTATAEGASAAWKPSGWKFTGADGTEVTPTDPGQQEARSWKGVMVTGGVVTVTADIAGQAKTASATVQVVARDWSNRPAEYSFVRTDVGEDRRLTLPARIEVSDDLGSANWFQTRAPTDSPPDHTAEVLGGANDGMKYFRDDTSVGFYGKYTVNTAAMQRGSNFYNAQERSRGGGGTRLGGMNWCDASVVTGALPGLVEQHEKYHGSAYAEALASALPAVLTRLEQSVNSDYGVLYSAYDAGWIELDAVARAASMAIHEETGNPGRLILRDINGDCALRNEFGDVLETSRDLES